MSFPPPSEALVTQVIFLVAICVFIVGAFRHRLVGGAPEEEILPAADAVLPPPLPTQAVDPVHPVGPYAAPQEESVYPVEPELPPLPGPLKVRTHWYQLKDIAGIGFFVFLYFAMQLGSGEKPDAGAEVRYTPAVLLVSMAFQVFCGGIAVGIMSNRVKLSRWLGLRWRHWPLCFAIAPLSVVAIWIFTGLLALTGWNTWVQEVLHARPVQEAVEILKNSRNVVVLSLMSISAAIIAPLVEETVFRGYIYPVAKRYCGSNVGIVFSSLVFAAAHGSAVALLPLFVLAVLLCLLYERTGSLWAPISVHVLFNGATVAFQLFLRPA